MKKLFSALLVCTVIMFTANTGCVKGGGGSPVNPVTVIPDIANFLLQGSTAFVKGLAANIHVSSSSLGDGAFTVNFSLSGSNTITSTAQMIMSGGTGTFTTPVMTSDGPTTVTINSISNSAGGSAALTTGNTSSMFDSTGKMVATYTPHGGTATAINTTDVTTSLSGGSLNIHGVMWEPNLTTIDLYDHVYSGATGIVSFNFNDPTTFNGSAAYGVAGTGITISDLSVHGTITISTVSPLLTGSFTYTNTDSSVVAGTFSCPAP